MEKAVELRTLDDEVLHNRGRGSVLAEKVAGDFDRDRYELARAGKQQVLKRRFGLVSMTGLSCGLMCTWESLLVVFAIGFQNGGPAGLIYGFLLVWLGNLSVFIAIGELSSAIPTAGGQYHWVSLLAPRSSKKFFSYMTGWLTVVGWIAALTAVCFFVADLTMSLVQLNHGGFEKSGWQGTMLIWAALVVCVIINIFISGALPTIEVVVLIIHTLGFFGILVPIVYLTPQHNSISDVFTTFNNGGGWNSKTLAFFVGIQGNALCFVGTDSPVHMSEEVKNSTRDVPRSMVLSLLINGCLALGMLFAVLFSTPDIPDLLGEGHLMIQVFHHTVGSRAGATIMTSIIIVLEFCSALGCLAAASRMTWSFARDRGLPFSRYISMIDKRTTIPVVAIIVVTILSATLSLINIGNNTAFNGTISLVLEGFYISYLLALGLLLWRRVRGDIHCSHSSTLTAFSSASPSETFEHHLSWGPWRLKGLLGIANNAVAICYLLLLIFFSFWPNAVAVTPQNMNWAVVVTGFVVLFSIGYYLIWARKSYTGPIVEVDLHEL
ncbi:amino acid transporter [Aaosphaeria arxii CBS 175.79]|uniref:Amino acid transporter n=1 Tax=Aaosphaeria arxii CBS 175.79 TaxID=1450172 RepID=A0A6A5XMB2_9PLEO|nr:amino acid transporter [Aaosphaeria arxii CBS 175.79]KAF2014378.1 amino acid transporter [Aaosphaeria arxii CBS 175.79]